MALTSKSAKWISPADAWPDSSPVCLAQRMAEGTLSPATVRQRVCHLGRAEFDEIVLVLGQEDLLLPPRSEASIYAEFVAVYFELRQFAGSFLPRYFPALENLEAVDRLLRQDVDVELNT